MSTPDPPLPAEAGLAAQSPAGWAASPAGHAPTPGVSAGVTRVPTSPTLPEPDPASLTLVLARMANELFAAPPSSPAAPSVSSPAALPAPTPAAPPASSPAAPPVSSPAADATNPFFAAPRFDALFVDGALPSFDASLLRLPLVDAPHDAPAAPTPVTARAPQFELDPVVGIELPQRGGAFDAHALRKEFPILEERVHGKRLVWLDNAATTQKPRVVIDRLKHFYEHENSNIHRAAHALAARATDAYEGARETVRRFLNASSTREVVFVRGATEGINLVAQSWGRRYVEPGDEIVVTWLEHHANIVPWQQLCAEKGARLRVAPVDDRGQVILSEYERLLGPRTRLVALPQVSNALGTVTPAAAMIEMAHRHGAKVLLDGAQSVSHLRVDVQSLGCDFFVLSGHKVFAPTGIGVVYGRSDVLDATPPWQGGGNMIQDVTFERTVYQGPPARFEAGTGSIADAVGLGAALDWLTRVGIENVARHEHALLDHATERVQRVPGLTIVGTAPEKAGVLSFVLAGRSTHEVSEHLDRQGIAVRGGHHCAQPILRRFGLESTVRASLAPYNTVDDIDALVDALCALQGQP